MNSEQFQSDMEAIADLVVARIDERQAAGREASTLRERVARKIREHPLGLYLQPHEALDLTDTVLDDLRRAHAIPLRAVIRARQMRQTDGTPLFSPLALQWMRDWQDGE